MESRIRRCLVMGLIFGFVAASSIFLPEMAFGSVEGSLAAIQARLISTVLPLVAILGLIFAGISLVMGNPNAKQHFTLALVGAAIGFGAPSLVAFVRSMIQ